MGGVMARKGAKDSEVRRASYLASWCFRVAEVRPVPSLRFQDLRFWPEAVVLAAVGETPDPLNMKKLFVGVPILAWVMCVAGCASVGTGSSGNSSSSDSSNSSPDTTAQQAIEQSNAQAASDATQAAAFQANVDAQATANADAAR
jgi:hypothetical protein